MEGYELKRGIALSATLALAGCATWSHGSITSPALEERQRVVDNAYCKRVAVGAAPMPSVSIPATQGAGGAWTQGVSTTYGPGGGVSRSTYSGSATPMGSFGGGFASGMAQGAAVGALMLARQQQDEIYAGCMTELGWSKGSAKKQLAPTPPAPQQAAQKRQPPVGRWEVAGNSGDGSRLFIDRVSAKFNGAEVTTWIRVLLPKPAGPGEGAMVDEWRELNTFHCGQQRRTLRAYVVLFNNEPVLPAEYSGDDVGPEDIPSSSLMSQFYRAACES